MHEREQSIVAIGYPYESSGYVNTQQPYVVAHERTLIKPLRLQEIGNVEQPVFECELLDPHNETEMTPVVVPLFGMLQAHDAQRTTKTAIDAYVTNSRIFVQRLVGDTALNFYAQPVHEQHRLLYDKVVREFLADITVEYDESVKVTVACSEMYEATQPGKFTPRSGGEVTSHIVDAAYIESSLSEPIHFTQKEDFFHEAQLPSFVIKQETGEICYIPAGSVTDIRSESEDY